MLAVAAACAALAAFFSVPVAGRAGSGAELSAKVTEPDIRLGQATSVEGRLSGSTAEAAGQPVTVLARPYPYARERLVETVRTDATGRYQLEVRPRLNTRYVARLEADPSVESSERPIAWVYPRKTATVARFLRPGRASARMVLEVDPNHPFRFQGRPLYFYFRKRQSKLFERVARARTRLAGPGDVTGSARFEIPRGDYTFEVSWCFDPGRRDFGAGRPVRRDCPRRGYRVGEKLGKHSR